MTLSSPAPALYIHIPFCLSRCAYCSFHSGEYQSDKADRYIRALAYEIILRDVFSRELKPSSIFIGGGTPSVLSLRQWEALLDTLPDLDQGGEFTCELNPDSACDEMLCLLLDHGVTRCSFGVQTFSDRGLSLLERRHDARTARQCVEKAVTLGFSSVNMDLIMGWPGQSRVELHKDIETAISCGVSHVSCYSLIIEKGTRMISLLEEKDLEEKTDEEYRIFWDDAESLLEEAGLEHYETSNYAKPGYRCRHNINTWTGGSYLGIGASAHSHLMGRRFSSVSNTEAYIETILRGKFAEVFSERLGKKEKARECALFWLRLYDGIESEAFAARTGYTLEELYEEKLEFLLNQGWLIWSEDKSRLFVPKSFHPLLDAILLELV